MAPRKKKEEKEAPSVQFGVEIGAEVDSRSPAWSRLQIPVGSILEVALHNSSVAIGHEGWFAMNVVGVSGNPQEGFMVLGSLLGCEVPDCADEVDRLLQDGGVHLCPEDPCTQTEVYVVHAAKIRLWTLESFRADYITAAGKAILRGMEAAAQVAAPSERKSALRARPKPKGDKAPGKNKGPVPVIRVPSDGEEGPAELESGEESPSHLRELLQRTKRRILGDGAGATRAPRVKGVSGGPDQEQSESVVEKSRLVTGTSLSPRHQTPLGVLPPEASSASGIGSLTKKLTSKGGAASALLAQAVQTSAQEARLRREKKKQKGKGDAAQQLLDLLRGKDKKKKKKKKSRRIPVEEQSLIKPDPGGPGSSGSSGSSDSSSGDSKRRHPASESDSDLSCEPPLKRRALKEPGSVMEMLIRQAQTQLDQASLLETEGAEASLVSGVKISTYFALLIRPYHSPASPLLRELYALAQSIDLLRLGKLPETADALASRFVAVHTALTEGSWATASHLELYPLEPVASATTAMMLEAHKHRRLVMRSQGYSPGGGWWSQGGRGKAGGNREKGKKGEVKGRGGRGKGKGNQKEGWTGGKGEQNPWKENKEEPPKK